MSQFVNCTKATSAARFTANFALFDPLGGVWSAPDCVGCPSHRQWHRRERRGRAHARRGEDCARTLCGQRAAGGSPRWCTAPRTTRNRNAGSKTTFARALERGYAVVVQDVRGRYASEGKFRPYQQEGQDGFDTIEWAATQDMVERRRRQLWPVLSRGGAVAGSGGKSPSPQGDGPGHDLRVARKPDLRASDPSTCRGLSGPGTTLPRTAAPAGIWRGRRTTMGRLPRGTVRARACRAHCLSTGWTPYVTSPCSTTSGCNTHRRTHGGPGPILRPKYGKTQAAVLNLSGWYDEGYGTRRCDDRFSRTAGRSAWSGGKSGAASGTVGPWGEGNRQRGGR